jgi:hypothetical protein
MTLKDPMKHLCRVRKYMSAAEIARRLTVMTGSPVHRVQVSQWLHPRKERRCEPRLKVALALLSMLAKEEGFFVVDDKGIHSETPKKR